MRNTNLGGAVSPDEGAVLIDLSTPSPTVLTFAQFDTAASALAAQLHHDYPAGARIGILGENSARWATLFYAVMRAGLVAVPISYRQPPHMVSFVVADAELAAVYVGDEYTNLLEPGTSAVVHRLEDVDITASSARFVADVDPEQPAMFLYTSGSTGKPKGVVLSHRSHLWVVGLGIESASAQARLMLSAPLYHMGALSPLQRALGAGQSVVLLPRFDSHRVLRAIEEHSVTDLNVVPPMAALLMKEAEALAVTDVSSVRTIILNSAPASLELLAELDRVFREPRFVFTYGTTESSPIAFTAPSDGRRVPFGSLGVPHPAVEIRLVDAAGKHVERDGVLQIRSPGLMSGYHRRPEIPSPITSDGYYHTKDLFQRDDEGFYYCLGREDDMFICGGENIYPRAVELALENHPAVSQAVVVPVDDAVKGQKPVAFVTLLPGRQVSEQELRSYSLTRLEPVAHPRRIWFLEALPLAATNKIDRALLNRQAAERFSGPTQP
ncbi:class I adenylate-forming enzyme family protein [Mycolicibacterium litorale]|uniref:class I adenylate-forming enzyme family protein n=1 Tax=Mycolicibacterium litorale TaxID=758802 RepID=UPI003CEB833B